MSESFRRWPEPFFRDQNWIDDELGRWFRRKRSGIPSQLNEAMAYAALAPGKRLRPILVLLGFDACGGAFRPPLRYVARDAAIAVEFVHVFSLIHDDLPALDNDEMRRGLPTVHRKFDEATAILAGDALLADAFYTLSTLDPKQVSAEQTRFLLQTLSSAAGSGHLIAGQMRDLAAEGRWGENLMDMQHTVSGVHEIQAGKTAALIMASLVIGGAVAGADPEGPELQALDRIGLNLGLAFQISDDLLNETGDPTLLGKASGSDRARGKATLQSVVGRDQAEEKRDMYLDSAARIAAEVFPQHKDRFATLAAFLAVRRT